MRFSSRTPPPRKPSNQLGTWWDTLHQFTPYSIDQFLVRTFDVCPVQECGRASPIVLLDHHPVFMVIRLSVRDRVFLTGADRRSTPPPGFLVLPRLRRQSGRKRRMFIREFRDRLGAETLLHLAAAELELFNTVVHPTIDDVAPVAERDRKGWFTANANRIMIKISTPSLRPKRVRLGRKTVPRPRVATSRGRSRNREASGASLFVRRQRMSRTSRTDTETTGKRPTLFGVVSNVRNTRGPFVFGSQTGNPLLRTSRLSGF